MTVQLPDEIVDQILQLACTLPALSGDGLQQPASVVEGRLKARSSAPQLDIPTTLKLLRLSPHYYHYIASILYKGPRLSDPISLSLFARTLTNRPALGRLVKHLWVGHTYQGEAIPTNTPNPGQAGTQNAYALNLKLATFSEVHECLAQGVPPSNLLSPEFEKQIAQWAAQNVQANTRISDPTRSPRGIHPDSPGSGDPDSRGWHWIGVDEWVLRLWDGRDLVIQFRELAQVSFVLELKRLLNHHTIAQTSPCTQQATPKHSESDRAARFSSGDAEGRRLGAGHDPMDRTQDSESAHPNLCMDDQPIYSEDLDLDALDSERDIYFAEMGVNTKRHKWSELAKVGDQMVEWWLIWSVARTRARARHAARRVFEVAQQNKQVNSWKPFRPPMELNAKNHFTHPTLFARSGASHLLVGGAPPPVRDEAWYGNRSGIPDYDSNSDSGFDSGSESMSEDSESETEAQSNHTDSARAMSRRPLPAHRDRSHALPVFVELEQQKSEDQADLWGGEHIFVNGNERAGAGNSMLGSRGGMFGFDSALRKGLFNETAQLPTDGTEYETLQRETQRKRNQEDRLLAEMTLGSILSSLRTVLMLSPRLQNLALDGVLERSVCGRRPMCSLGKLKSLSLGPPPPYWCSPLLFGHPMKTTRRQRISYHQKARRPASPGSLVDESRSQSVWPLPGVLIPSPAFATLRTLHISGCMLFPSEAKAVGGLGGQLPSLRHFRWSLWQPHVEGHPVGVVETLCAILDMPTPEEQARLGPQQPSTGPSSRLGPGSASSSSRSHRELETGKRRRRHEIRHRTSQSPTLGASLSDLTTSDPVPPSAAEIHQANLYALVTRKRKLRSVYATLHATDEAIFARKAPLALRSDPRLKIETAKCQATEDNLGEMQRWWEWESGLLHFKPTVSNLEAISAAAKRKQSEGPPASVSAQELNADHIGMQFDLGRAMGMELDLGSRPATD